MFPALAPGQQLQKAFDVYHAALASPFYAAKYASSPPPTDDHTWWALPILTHEELFDNTYPRSTAMLTQPLEGMIVSSTGGTTGVARYTVFTHREWDTFVDMQARALQLLGVGTRDRIANLFMAGHLWPSFLGVHETIKRVGAVHLPISANIPFEEIIRLCREFDPSVMLSLTTFFVFLADITQKEGYQFPSLRVIGYGGEQMSEPAERSVRQALPGVEIRALAYSSADAGLMGYQCTRCGFATYHVPTDFQLIEIRNPQTGASALPGEEGELIVTNLARRSMPIIRYQIGDVGTFLDATCACGDPNPLLRLAGRAGEDFKIGGAFVSMKVFDESLGLVSAAVSMNYTVELEDIGNQMDIRLLVEAADPDKARGVEAQLREAVRQRIPEIRIGLEKNYIRNFEIRFVTPGALPRSPITGKVRRLVDKRVVPEASDTR
jgi:phenylacetate-CoA ligase